MDIFTKTMTACLESKRSNTVVPKKTTVAKNTTNKKVVESAKKITRKVVKEADEFDDEFAGTEENPVEAPDFVDDVVVVVDPELDQDEISQTADNAQEIINDTPEGETPTTEEYLDDFTYTCPICGNTFFSETELNAGDKCPVCGETPDNFVLAGQVAEADGTADEGDEGEAPEEGDEDLDLADPEEPKDESRKPVRRGRVEAKKPIKKPELNLDESVFNRYLTRFIRENYKNAESFNIVKATKSGSTLTFECALKYKSGSTKKVVLKAEGYKPGTAVLRIKDDGTFKAESANKSIMTMKVSTTNNVIRCEGFNYDFNTKLENKRVRVVSKAILESAARRSMRTPSKRVSESVNRTIGSKRMPRRTSRRTTR